jgi:tRNA G18 (ribose-2'-O)-methylase SpoU
LVVLQWPAVRLIDLQSLEDPRLDGYRNLKDAELRLRRGEFIVEGRGPLRRMIEESPLALRSVLMSPAAFEAQRALLERLDEATPVFRVDGALLAEISGFRLHRGCLGLAERPTESGFDALLAGLAAGEGPSLVVVLESLTNHDNVGGVFRNAMAFGADAVILCPRCCDPLYRKAIRTSIGATLCVPFARGEGWPETPLEALKAAGYTVVAVDPRGDPLEPAKAPADGRIAGRTALLLGTEGTGITPEARALADRCLRIDMAPGFDSLNVATAAAIAMHHEFAWRRRGEPGARG